MKSWMDMFHKHASRVAATTTEPTWCPWSEGKPVYPPWQGKEANLSYSFIDDLNKAGVHVVLGGGALLGAVRHQGAIPFDLDIDAGLQVCDASNPNATSPGFKWSCKEAARLRKSRGDTGFNEMISEWLEPKFRMSNVKVIQAVRYGVRLSNGAAMWDGGLAYGQGIGMDVATSTDYGNPQVTASVCKCTFGYSVALCPIEAKAMLAEKYGDDFMTPKSQCDYYAEHAKKAGTPDWNTRSWKQCGWAKEIIKEKDANLVRWGQAKKTENPTKPNHEVYQVKMLKNDQAEAKSADAAKTLMAAIRKKAIIAGKTMTIIAGKAKRKAIMMAMHKNDQALPPPGVDEQVWAQLPAKARQQVEHKAMVQIKKPTTFLQKAMVQFKPTTVQKNEDAAAATISASKMTVEQAAEVKETSPAAGACE